MKKKVGRRLPNPSTARSMIKKKGCVCGETKRATQASELTPQGLVIGSSAHENSG